VDLIRPRLRSGGFPPLSLPTSHRSALLCSRTSATALLAVDSHRRAGSVPSVRAIRSASTPCTFYTELLPGALPTEAGQWSSPHRHLPPHELTAKCHAPSFSSRASTSRRSPATSRPTSATPSPPMTCCLSHRRLPVHHQLLPLVSASPSDPLDLVRRCTVLPLTTTFPANSPLAGRNRPAEPRR
jgi:hypothetical protein